MAAFAGPRRYQPPVFAGQCPLAGWETVSKSAIDRTMTEDRGVIARFLKSLTQQRERPFRGGRNGVIQINAAARLSPKEFAQ